MSDVDHDPPGVSEPEHPEARLPAQSESERNDAFEVAGQLDLPKIGA